MPEAMKIAAAVLPEPQTFIYRTIEAVSIEADVYLPPDSYQTSTCPVFLYIHGGGWMAGNRKEVNGPLLHEFLQRGFIVTSVDYRLIFSMPMEGQFDDIRASESWAREDLPSKVKNLGFNVASDRVIVGGASAGGHLALMTPRLWQAPPLALLVFYSPTNFRTVIPRVCAIEFLKNLLPITSEVIKAASHDTPPTNTLLNTDDSSKVAARLHIAHELTKNGGIGEFLAAGPTEKFELRPPGSLPAEDIVRISPGFLPLANYPPTFHVIGTEDIAFEVDQATWFAERLTEAGVPCMTMILENGAHGFDEGTEIGDGVHLEVVKPAVDFVCQTLTVSKREIKGRGVVRMHAPADCAGQRGYAGGRSR